MGKKTYKMWNNGPDIVLPDGYYWSADTQEVIKNDGTWRGSLL